MYVGAATLRLLLGDYSLPLTAVVSALVVAAGWPALLRMQARRWLLHRSSVGPRRIEEGRRWGHEYNDRRAVRVERTCGPFPSEAD